MYAIIKNNQITEYPIVNLPHRFPNISFPEIIHDAILPEFIVRVILGSEPIYNNKTHRISLNSNVVFVDGYWQQQYDVIPLIEQELQEVFEIQSKNIRDKRNALLSECDWTQTVDAPVDRSAWAEYRQALRDITGQAGFSSDNLIWPTKPQ